MNPAIPFVRDALSPAQRIRAGQNPDEQPRVTSRKLSQGGKMLMGTVRRRHHNVAEFERVRRVLGGPNVERGGRKSMRATERNHRAS